MVKSRWATFENERRRLDSSADHARYMQCVQARRELSSQYVINSTLKLVALVNPQYGINSVQFRLDLQRQCTDTTETDEEKRRQTILVTEALIVERHLCEQGGITKYKVRTRCTLS